MDHALTPDDFEPVRRPGGGGRGARRAGRTIDYHLKIDTGMNRLGFRHDNLARTLPGVLASPHLRLDGAFTHFAAADVPESPLFETQRTRFDTALADTRRPGRDGRACRHAANSAALLRDSRVLVRRRAARPAALRHRAAAAGVDDCR